MKENEREKRESNRENCWVCVCELKKAVAKKPRKSKLDFNLGLKADTFDKQRTVHGTLTAPGGKGNQRKGLE